MGAGTVRGARRPVRRAGAAVLAVLVVLVVAWRASRSTTWQLLGEIVPRVEVGRPLAAAADGR